jgi:hypothetical protein
MVDKVALVQVLSEYFGFPCQVSFHEVDTVSSQPKKLKKKLDKNRYI